MFAGKLTTINDVITAMNMNLKNLQPDCCYTLENLVGKKAWKRTHKSHRLQLGIEFKALAKAGGLPVVWAGRTPCNKQLYQLK